MEHPNLRRFWESSARSLFRRCVQCPNDEPSCPTCASDEVCTLISTTCDACQSNICVKAPSSPPSAGASTSSPAGPIAGGVIGGIALVAVAVFLVYWFYMRPKKKSWANQQLDHLKEIPTPDHHSFVEQRESKRQSTHTVASFKTTGSRASIPIAYIPGVTSRNDASSPDMIPPVPPIPVAGSLPAGTLSPRMNTGTEVFFSSRDLRPESSYTDADPSRRSMARSTRSSIAASEYHNDAIIDPMPAQRVMPVKATPISLQSKSSYSNMNSPNRSPTSTPPLSHQNSISQRMQGPITGTTGQARQITITRSSSNTRGPNHMNAIAELDDTSTGAPTPRMIPSELDDTSVGSRTPKLGFDRSGTASPRSMLSDDAEDLMREGRFRRPSNGGLNGLRSPDINNPPVSAAGQSTFSRSSPVSAMGWDPQANIRNTIQNAASLAYGSQIAGGYGPLNNGNHHDSPFADRHAMNGS